MYLKQRLEIRLTDQQTGTQPYNQYQQMKYQFVSEVIKAAFSQVNHLSAESFLNTFFSIEKVNYCVCMCLTAYIPSIVLVSLCLVLKPASYSDVSPVRTDE